MDKHLEVSTVFSFRQDTPSQIANSKTVLMLMMTKWKLTQGTLKARNLLCLLKLLSLMTGTWA